MKSRAPVVLVSRSAGETREIAKAIGVVLPASATIGLVGELGAGKTEFTRGLVAALGGGDEVSSPTFVLEQIYPLPNGRAVFHWDLYRLPRESELPALQAEIEGSEGIVLVEWVDRAVWLDEYLTCRISFQCRKEIESEREISIESQHDFSYLKDLYAAKK